MSNYARPGQRRSRIVIQNPVKTKQANGSVNITWNTFATLWAKVETLEGRSREAAQASWPKAENKITIQYKSGILPTMRVSFNGTIYSILNVNNVDMRNRELVLTCESGVAAS